MQAQKSKNWCATAYPRARSVRRSRTADRVVLPDLPSLAPQRITSTGLHATCRTSLMRSSRARRKARVLPMDPPACALSIHPCCLRRPTLLRYALRRTFSGILGPCSSGTHIVFGKADVRMLFWFDALRISILPFHSCRTLDRTVADRTALSWRSRRRLRALDSRSVCWKARSRAICDSRPGINIAACSSCMCEDNCAYEYDSLVMSFWTAISRAAHSRSEDVRTALRPSAPGTHSS